MIWSGPWATSSSGVGTSVYSASGAKRAASPSQSLAYSRGQKPSMVARLRSESLTAGTLRVR